MSKDVPDSNVVNDDDSFEYEYELTPEEAVYGEFDSIKELVASLSGICEHYCRTARYVKHKSRDDAERYAHDIVPAFFEIIKKELDEINERLIDTTYDMKFEYNTVIKNKNDI